jgi:hypothetical protein
MSSWGIKQDYMSTNICRYRISLRERFAISLLNHSAATESVIWTDKNTRSAILKNQPQDTQSIHMMMFINNYLISGRNRAQFLCLAALEVLRGTPKSVYEQCLTPKYKIRLS